MNIEQLRAALAATAERLRTLDAEIGDSAPTDEQNASWTEARTAHESAQTALTDAETSLSERRALVGSLPAAPVTPATRTAPVLREAGDGNRNAPNVNTPTDPFEVPEQRRNMNRNQYRTALIDANLRAIEGRDLGGSENEKHYESTLRRHLRSNRPEDLAWAENLLARSHDDYESGFSKLMLGRAELLTNEERTAMSVGTSANGGYLLPTHLDPTIILTNAGSSNVIRQISRVVTLAQGHTVWHGITSAGVTASWDGELAEVSDDSPTFGNPSVSTNVAQAFVQGSIAAFEDIAGLQSDVMMMFADARDRLEGVAHATGLGASNQPKGIVTALDASTTVEITSTTAATIGEVDLHAMYRGVGVRWRRNGKWLLNPLYSLAIKRLGTAVSSTYSGDLREPVAGRILGQELVESDDMPTTQTTTALDNEIVYGDFSQYVIADKPGGMSVEFIPHLFNTSNNLPDGRRGWYAYWRTGADCVNLSAFRLLQDKTSA